MVASQEKRGPCLNKGGMQGVMHLTGRPVGNFDPEGLIFAVGLNSELVKLYDLRTFDKVGSPLDIS